MSYGPWVLIIFFGLNPPLQIEGIKDRYTCREMMGELFSVIPYDLTDARVAGACVNKALRKPKRKKP